MIDKVVFFSFSACLPKWTSKGTIFSFKTLMHDVVLLFFYNFNRANKMKCHSI